MAFTCDGSGVEPFCPPGGARMLILTGAPTPEETNAREINRGRPKRKLRQMLQRAGVNPDEVAYASSICKGSKGEPSPKQLMACREHLRAFVERVNPNVILTMGTSALETAHKPLSIFNCRGDLFRSATFDRKLVPTYAPGACLRDWNLQPLTEHDIRKAWSTASTDKYPLRLGEEYYVCTTVEEVRAALEYLKTRPIVAFDIETEGFDLFEQDEILCVQLSGKAGEAFVIPLRGAWRRHDEDVYADWQLEHGEWGYIKAYTEVNADGVETIVPARRVLYDSDSLKEHEKNPKKKKRIFNPAFPKGSVVCQRPDAHNPYSPAYEKKGHICRGFVTNVLGGKPTLYPGNGRMYHVPVPADYIEIVALLKDFLEGPTPKAAQNGKFDVHGLRYQLDIRVRNFVFDTILAYHIIHEERPHDLEMLRSLLTWMPRYNTELKTYVPTKKHSFALVPNEVLWLYGAADADCEYRLIEPLREWLVRDNPEDGMWLFENIAMPLQRTLTQIEENGIYVNRARLNELAEWYRNRIHALYDKLDVMCKEHNLTPPEKWTNDNQLRSFLYETTYDWEIKKATKTKPAITTPMRGMGLPLYIAWRSKKTNAPSTGKKSFAALRAWCREEVQYEFKNISEDKQIRVPTKKPLGPRSRAQRAWKLEMLGLIEELKKCVKAKTQFLDGDDTKEVVGAQALLKHIKSDGRVHTQYNQLVETARLSSRAPNLQNITNTSEDPVYSHYGIRSMFGVPNGYDFLSADYRSEEVRIMAYLSGDMKLLEATMTCYGSKDGSERCGLVFMATDDDPDRPLQMMRHEKETGHVPADVHQWVASQVFGVPYDEVTKEQRRQCKSVTFGLAYGQTERGLADALGWTIERAEELIKMYFEAFPLLAEYQEMSERLTKSGEDSSNAFGRLRHTTGPLEMKDFTGKFEWRKIVNAMVRERLNYPTQSTAADVISLDTIALGDVWGFEDGENTVAHKLGRKLCDGEAPALMLRALDVLILNTVHDALEFQSPTNKRAVVSDIIERVMVGIPWHILGWYLPVDITYGRYWDDVGEDEYSDVRPVEDDEEEEEAA